MIALHDPHKWSRVQRPRLSSLGRGLHGMALMYRACLQLAIPPSVYTSSILVCSVLIILSLSLLRVLSLSSWFEYKRSVAWAIKTDWYMT